MGEIKYVTGPAFGQNHEVSPLALGSFEYINRDLMDIKHNYIKLGFHLRECERCGYWADFGFSSFADFVYDNFKLDKSALSRCLSVYRRFRDEQDNVGKMWINPKYEDYSYSQLCEMVSMSDAEIKKVKPDMTIQQIRDFKKELKQKKTPEVSSGCDVATDGLNVFDYDKFLSLHGAASSAYVKSRDCKSIKLVYMFDKNGNYISCLSNCWAYILFDEKGNLILRVSVSAPDNIIYQR